MQFDNPIEYENMSDVEYQRINAVKNMFQTIIDKQQYQINHLNQQLQIQNQKYQMELKMHQQKHTMEHQIQKQNYDTELKIQCQKHNMQLQMDYQKYQMQLQIKQYQIDQLNQSISNNQIQSKQHIQSQQIKQYQSELQTKNAHVNQMKKQIQQCNIDLHQLKQKHKLDLQIKNNQLLEIREQIEQWIQQQTESIDPIKEQQILNDPLNQLTVKSNNIHIQNLTKLNESEIEVEISNVHQLEYQKKCIIDYNQQQKQYKIIVNFSQYDTSLDDKSKIIEIIDGMKVNEKVGEIVIVIENNKNQFNEEIIGLMNDRYTNLCNIYLTDVSDSVNTKIHDKLKQMVKSKRLLGFGLLFRLLDRNGTLFDNKQGLQLMKEYNQLIKQQQYLEWLSYWHNTSGEKYNDQKNEIVQIVDQISKM